MSIQAKTEALSNAQLQKAIDSILRMGHFERTTEATEHMKALFAVQLERAKGNSLHITGEVLTVPMK